MNTKIIANGNVVPEFTFPGLFKSKETGSIWLAHSKTQAIRVVAFGEIAKVGDLLCECRSNTVIVSPDFSPITEPLVIKFTP